MENDREPMDSLTDRTASLLRYDDRRRQLDLLCVIGVHSSVRYGMVCSQQIVNSPHRPGDFQPWTDFEQV